MDAYLICPETRKAIWLGKPIRSVSKEGAQTTRYFHRGYFDGPMNHECETSNKLVWKFLADHAHKELRVVFGGEYDDDLYERVDATEVETDNYLQGWPPRDL